MKQVIKLNAIEIAMTALLFSMIIASFFVPHVVIYN